MAEDAPGFPKGFSAMGPFKAAEEQRRDSGFSALYCGQAAGLAYSTTAAELTSRLAADALRHLEWMAGTIELSAH